MTCCSILVAMTIAMGYGDLPDRATGFFSTPMFLRGQPIWVTPVSRRQLLRDHEERGGKKTIPAQTDVAVALA